MKIIDKPEDAPEGTSRIVTGKDGVCRAYFADDVECIEAEFLEKKSVMYVEFNELFKKDERKLEVNKEQYKDLRDATLVGIGHRGKSAADTKQAFKQAVETRKALQDKRDNLHDLIQDATTIEELDAISWT